MNDEVSLKGSNIDNNNINKIRTLSAAIFEKEDAE
jgi:hypothetical protein